jgi:succinate dehydrogenase / fumarate reductase, iron-sulfur subunit
MPTLHLRILRGGPNRESHFQTYTVEVAREAHILDAVHLIWATQDSTLMFRHACHHASCGLCGARVNGRERLMCITPVSEFADGVTITLEPLRHFPWLGDLVVEMTPMMARMAGLGFAYVRGDEITTGEGDAKRFEDCIECGLCMSICPVVGTDSHYVGPAPLAMITRLLQEPRGDNRETICAMADHPHGAWRCHSVVECSEVCPSNVDPSRAIGWLRRYLAFGGRRETR